MVFGLAFGGVAAVVGVLAVVLPMLVVYDVLVNRAEMQPLEKLVWIGAVVVFHVFGLLAYYIIVHRHGTLLFDEVAVGQDRMDELERLQQLHEDGALTDEEFEQEKERVLGED